jgi:hypothetical protein
MISGARGGNSRRHVSAGVVKVLPPRVRVWADMGINAILLSRPTAGPQSGGSRRSCGIERTAILRSDDVIGFVV